jgi:LPXTG-motif cell wall-anchored protein
MAFATPFTYASSTDSTNPLNIVLSNLATVSSALVGDTIEINFNLENERLLKTYYDVNVIVNGTNISINKLSPTSSNDYKIDYLLKSSDIVNGKFLLNIQTVGYVGIFIPSYTIPEIKVFGIVFQEEEFVPAHYDGIETGITSNQVSLSVDEIILNVDGIVSTDSPSYRRGEFVYVNFQGSNYGSVPVTNVKFNGLLFDDLLEAGDDLFAGISFDISETETADSITNNYVLEYDYNSVTYSKTYSVTINIIDPSVSASFVPQIPFTINERDVNFSLFVTNNGNVPLNDLANEFVDGTFSLVVGETKKFDVVLHVNTDQPMFSYDTYVNSQEYGLSQLASSALGVTHPSVDLTVTTNRNSLVSGQNITYTFKVVNNGDTLIENITIVGDGVNETVDSLLPNQEYTFDRVVSLSTADRNSGLYYQTSFTASGQAFVFPALPMPGMIQPFTMAPILPNTFEIITDSQVVSVRINSVPSNNETPIVVETPVVEEPTEEVPVVEEPTEEVPVVEEPVVIEEELTPESGNINTDSEVALDDELTPLDAPELPKTGEVPSYLYMVFGSLVSGLGLILRRNK